MNWVFAVIYWGGMLVGGLVAISLLALAAAFWTAERHERRKGFIPTRPRSPSRWRGHHRAQPPHPSIW